VSVDLYELSLTVGGFGALLAAWIPSYTSRRPLSLPIVLVVVGALFFIIPVGLPAPDPMEHLSVTERATELAVIVALMGAGLEIDRPFDVRTWGTTWRMLGIAMPLTIALTALFGVTAGGIAGASALLLGAVLAPTDPVLASDVQVAEPTLDEHDNPEPEDEVRFTLTSEGGLNDALAFPFVYAAIAFVEQGSSLTVWLSWAAWDLVGRILIALVVGWAVGRLLGVVAFRPPGRLSALAETPQGFVAIAVTLLAYGATELLQGYGFLAVFVAAVVLRGTERTHELPTFTRSPSRSRTSWLSACCSCSAVRWFRVCSAPSPGGERWSRWPSCSWCDPSPAWSPSRVRSSAGVSASPSRSSGSEASVRSTTLRTGSVRLRSPTAMSSGRSSR
jgi:NhaP-type Na+/H+ or K+/H+ antiporter